MSSLFALRRLVLAGAVFAAAGCARTPGPGEPAFEVVRHQDLIVDPRDHTAVFDTTTMPHTCADETAFGIEVGGGERRRYRFRLERPSTLLVSACRQAGGTPAGAGESLRLRVIRGGGRTEELALPLAEEWRQERFELAPEGSGEVGLYLSPEVPAGVRVIVRDLVVSTNEPAPAARPARRAILISLDAFREDAVGALGGRTRTPNLDRLLGASAALLPCVVRGNLDQALARLDADRRTGRSPRLRPRRHAAGAGLLDAGRAVVRLRGGDRRLRRHGTLLPCPVRTGARLRELAARELDLGPGAEAGLRVGRRAPRRQLLPLRPPLRRPRGRGRPPLRGARHHAAHGGRALRAPGLRLSRRRLWRQPAARAQRPPRPAVAAGGRGPALPLRARRRGPRRRPRGLPVRARGGRPRGATPWSC